ncbi:uncharacterized protein [Miscanthus floridulus]|uniref:uncharacterized protein n=1 Tax=Miscanthus floridulus TaxID=154761 RepID=UPI003458626D
MAPGLRAGVVLISPDGSRLRYASRLHFSASNNATEYEALINGLRIAIELGTTRLYVRGDSELVVDQVMKESSCKSPLMVTHCQEVHKLEDKFHGIELHHIPRRDNDTANFLAKLTARQDLSPSRVFINDIHEPSTHILEGPTRTHPNV